MRFLEARGSGYRVGTAVVPIVPAAVIFDLGIGDPGARPDAAMGLAACHAATTDAPAEGSVGAGTGATFGKQHGRAHAVKGGIGTASTRVGEATLGALVVLNAVGDVVDESGKVLRRAGGSGPAAAADPPVAGSGEDGPLEVGASTTIGVVATDLPLDKAGAARLAQAAHDGLARAVHPAHTAFDGDTFFALSTAPVHERTWPVPVAITAAAADVVATAIRRAARLARGLRGVPGLADEPDAANAPPRARP
jgi:L-aminopeptidase/D-esterase-like protein